MLKGVFAF